MGKPLKRLMIAVAVMIGIIIMLPLISQAASYASKFAWRDDAGNIVLKTDDKHRTSNICYNTIGFTATRCVLGTMEPIEEQYITIRFNDATIEDVPIGNGFTTSAFKVTESEFLAKVAAASGDWLADIQSGKTCYIKFDAIMQTIDYSLPDGIRYSGWMQSDSNQDYFYNWYNPIPGVYDKFNKDDLKYNTYGWASPESINTHYDIYLLYNGGEEEPPVVTDEFVTRIGKDKPEYYTWNTSDEFDLSEGIPSGEDITNGYGADKWYGNVNIGKHESERSYVLSYDLIYHVYSPEYLTNDNGNYVLDGSGNKIQTGVKDDIFHVPYSFTVKRKASYYYAMGINLYELKEANVYNSVYPGDEIKYPSNGHEVPMDVILDGERNPSSVDDWTSNEDAHIKWPDAYTDTIEIDCGEGSGSVLKMYNHLNEVLYDDVITDEDPIKGITSWNDLIEVNNNKYMDDEKVYHANDTSKVRIEFKPMSKGKDDTMYLFHEKEKTVTIPEDVANGSYATSLDVIYNHRILNDHTVMAFSTNDTGNSIYEHLKPGFEKNEPVFVHTPVISPVIIKNGEDSTQLVTENKTDHTGMVDKDGRVPDGKAIYELILDNEYTFEFDAALHREIQGYGWSGDPSKFDKYVKGKYVAFPFTAQVKVNGEYGQFYKVDDNTVDDEGNEKLAGYTKWIEVEYSETDFYIPPWAIEKEYYEIKYKVEAYNVFDENGEDHTDDQEGTANTETNGNNEAINYVATYVVPVELSGIIYDFEIIGTNYYEDYNVELESGVLGFCPRKEEKKQGNKNRMGGTSVRYTLDGEITTNWEYQNTLPMSMGTSGVWTSRGYLVSGDIFSFSVKTMANLWDEEIDRVVIKPTFRWYDYDGTVHDDIQIYYWDDDKDAQLIRYGSELDLKELVTEEDDGGRNHFSFETTQLVGSVWDSIYTRDKTVVEVLTSDITDYDGDYHDEDLIYTYHFHNLNYTDQWSFGQMMNQKSLSYCLSAIELNSKMRTLTGNYEELQRNLDKERLDLEKFVLDAETLDKMKYSMQTWYGNFEIPTRMLICDADTFENLGATDINGDGEVDYWDYLVCTDGVVDKQADFWLNKYFVPAGYLMLNFDIQTINNGKPHLTYFGGTKDMWQVQGAKQEVSIGVPGVEETSKGKYPVVEIQTVSGDVAVINPNKSMYDRYKPGILMIN